MKVFFKIDDYKTLHSILYYLPQGEPDLFGKHRLLDGIDIIMEPRSNEFIVLVKDNICRTWIDLCNLLNVVPIRTDWSDIW